METLPVQTREALETDGRSQAALIAQLDDPAECVVLDTSGSLPVPPGLARLAST